MLDREGWQLCDIQPYCHGTLLSYSSTDRERSAFAQVAVVLSGASQGSQRRVAKPGKTCPGNLSTTSPSPRIPGPCATP